MRDNIEDFIMYLNSVTGYVTSSILAKKFGISNKTILKRVDEYNDILQDNGAYIKKLTGKGLELEIYNKNQFDKFMQNLHKYNITNQNERRNHIILILLLANKPLSVAFFVEKFYVSESTINNDFRIIRQQLEKAKLKLTNIRGEGYIITGDELILRQYISQYMKNFKWEDIYDVSIPKLNVEKLRERLKDILINHNLMISGNGFLNLYNHIVIMIKRLNHNNYKPPNDKSDIKKLVFNEKISQIVVEIIEYIESLIGIRIPLAEQELLKIQLSSKQIVEDEKDININVDIKETVSKMLEQVNLALHIDLSDELELRENLALHLVSVIYRLNYNISIDNPLVTEIKDKCPMGFVIAQEAVKVLEEKYPDRITENEIAFFALHFNIAMNKKYAEKKSEFQKKVLIVCGTGRSSAKLLEYQLKDYFSELISEIEITNPYRLKNISIESFDCIFSTVPLDGRYKIPVIEVSYFLGKNEIYKIENFLKNLDSKYELENIFHRELFFSNLQSKTKDDFIKEMINRIKELKEIKENTFKLVLEREEIITTEVGNLIAIPHTIDIASSDTIIAVGISEEKVLWNKKDVQLVFLFILGSDEKDLSQIFYQVISKFLLDEQLVLNLVDKPDYNYFIQQAKRIVNDNPD